MGRVIKIVNEENKYSIKQQTALSPSTLKKVVDDQTFDFDTTEQLPELLNILGQERAQSVMEFALQVNKTGYNIYVAGHPGTGKTTFTHSILDEFAKQETTLYDWCYVNNFEDQNAPKVLQLPVGYGLKLQEDMEMLIDNLKSDLPKAFNNENYQEEKKLIVNDYKEKTRKITEEVNNFAREHGFAIRQTSAGIVTIPLQDGKEMSNEQIRALGEEKMKELNEISTLIKEKILDTTNKVRKIEKEATNAVREFDNKVALRAIEFQINELKRKYKTCEDVVEYLDELQADILKNKDEFLQDEQAQQANPFIARQKQPVETNYTVNLIVDNSQTAGAPIVTADNPTYYNLIGKVEYEGRMGVVSTDFTKIKPGYLHEANGGYLIIHAKDIFANPYAWEGLKRSLLNQNLQIENISEQSGLMATTSINPDPIPLNVKVIIIGNMDIYQILYHHEEDFSKLFKIRADFDIEMADSFDNMMSFASFINTQCRKHDLRHFDRSAVAKLLENSFRLSGKKNKLSTRFNQQVEIIFEANAWAKIMDDDLVSEKHIIKAIKERDYRSGLFEEKIQESIDEGTILIDVEGEKSGQVNGLSVYNLGQYSFGKPSRITATTFVGKHGIINIERESKMSGNIHNKGIYILGGYLGQKFAQKYPLSLTAHIAFEQSYGGVDGDSASSTELYAILSSLADVPIDQGIAVTGSINQNGEIQPIGGANEKIEGFYTVCKNKGLTGKQGVLIPHQNVNNLMLSDEVIQAVKEDKFHIYAIETVEQGIEILTGMPAGERTTDGSYEKNTVYQRVADKLKQYEKSMNTADE